MHPSEAITEFLFYTAFICVMMLQVFLPSYFGSEISLNFRNLTNALYNSNWRQATVEQKRLIIIFMGHLNNPVVLKACRVFPIGRESFLSVKWLMHVCRKMVNCGSHFRF